jgi:hypothetical protein
MKDRRPGEHLWDQWSGEGYSGPSESDLIFYTMSHVDMDIEVVTRALASSLQREGVVDSLKEGFDAVRNADITIGWAGFLDDDPEMIACDSSGETAYGDLVAEPFDVTWVEIFL